MTIDLNDLLYGKPEWADVVDFFQNGEFCEDQYLVEAIKKFLRTEEDRQLLFKLDLSLEDCMNGRYGADKEQEVKKMYAGWNKKLGFKAFLE